MEVAREFVTSGELMASVLGRLLEGHLTPPALFINIIAEKWIGESSFFQHKRPSTNSSQCVSHGHNNRFL